MPQYKYRCLDCNMTQEVWHDINAKHSVCEDCEGELIRIIDYKVAVAYKGPGFYATDNETHTY